MICVDLLIYPGSGLSPLEYKCGVRVRIWRWEGFQQFNEIISHQRKTICMFFNKLGYGFVFLLYRCDFLVQVWHAPRTLGRSRRTLESTTTKAECTLES